MEINHTRFYVKNNYGTHTKEIIHKHGWTKPGKGESKLIEPIYPDKIKQLESTISPDK